MKSFITHTTENYEEITTNLVKSIRRYSQYPIRVYTIDYGKRKFLCSTKNFKNFFNFVGQNRFHDTCQRKWVR